MQGAHFVKLGDTLLRVAVDTLVRVATIPRCSGRNGHNKLFSHGNRLFVCNGRNQVFRLEAESGRLVLQTSLCGNHFACWCGRTVRLIPTRRVVVALHAGRELRLCTVHSDIECFSFCLGGVACYQNRAGTDFVLVNLLDYQVVRTEDPRFDCKNVHNILRLGPSGLVIDDELIRQHLGDEFVTRRNAAYRQFLAD